MWSKKPDAGGALARAGRRRASGSTRTSVSPVVRSISARAASCGRIVAHARLHRLGVDLEALGAGDRRRRRGRARRRPRRSRTSAIAAAEVRGARAPRRSARRRRSAGRGWSRRRSRRRRCRASRPTNTQPGAADPRRERLGLGADELEVLGRERVGERERALEVRRRHERDDASPTSARSAPSALRARRATLAASGDRPRPGCPAPCSAWAQQVERDRARASASRVGDHDQLAGPGEAVDADLPEHLALGLLDVERCPGPTITSTGAAPSRCRSASAAIAWAPPIAVDLVDAAQRAGGEDRPGRPRRRRPGGAHTAISRTPAARAVTTPITTVLGYGARPAGHVDAARRTGTSRSRDRAGPAAARRRGRSRSAASATARTFVDRRARRPSRDAGSSASTRSSSSRRVDPQRRRAS